MYKYERGFFFKYAHKGVQEDDISPPVEDVKLFKHIFINIILLFVDIQKQILLFQERNFVGFFDYKLIFPTRFVFCTYERP